MSPYSCILTPPPSLGAVIHEPTAFRSTCLLAIIHHSWQAGIPVTHDPTFLFHKINSIREVNEWLADPSIPGGERYTRLITTLSFIEVHTHFRPHPHSHPCCLLLLFANEYLGISVLQREHGRR